jgi:hypothetical protein
MLKLLIQTMMSSLKVFLKNSTNGISRHKKKDEFSRRRFGFGEKEDSNYGGETEEKGPV